MRQKILNFQHLREKDRPRLAHTSISNITNPEAFPLECLSAVRENPVDLHDI